MRATDLGGTLERVRPFTMVAVDGLRDLAGQVRAVLTFDIPGNFVECGVWRGGASFLMADLLRQAGIRDRKVWLFDSFEGLPPPEQIDGPAALAYVKNTDSPWYFDNCSATLEEVQRAATDLGLGEYTEFVKGWFDQTLPAHRERIGQIALLRIDGDWYSSVRCCLESLYDSVVDGGFIILDDYYAYDGCAIAVHEFLGARGLSHRIESVTVGATTSDHYQLAVFRKGKPTWKFLQQLLLAVEEMTAVIPPRSAFILVDQGWFGALPLPERRVMPFCERDGEYWGPPADDNAAIRELDRLRRAGAEFIAVMWPAFWWLDHYAGFTQYVRAGTRCLLANDRVMIFDLRESSGPATPRLSP